MTRKKLVHGVGVSDDGEFARCYTNDFGKNKGTKEYVLWVCMIERCYSEKRHIKYPSYIDCYASKNFKSFQYFASWCQNQIGFNLEGYQLDKDLILKGNKRYSEDTCVFIPSNMNNFLTSTKAMRGEFPLGVHLYRGNRYASQIGGGKGKRTHLGYFQTPELAFQAYKIAKEAMAKELAIQYEGLVDNRVVDALNNFVVNIDD
jgi:hypothetical protein